jgi:hypothetical protein
VSQRIDFVRSSLPSSEQLILETVEETTHGVVLRVRAKQEGNESVERIGQILSMFLDDSIADSVPFGEVKGRAFGILERAKFTRAAEYIGAHGFDTTAIEWEFVASFALSFKQHLRPLLLQLPFAAHSEDDNLMEAVAFLRQCFDNGESLSRYSFDQMPKAFIPQG